MKTPRLRTALLGSGAVVALLAASGPVAADEIDELRAQINALQSKVSQLESQQADQTATPRIAPAAAVQAGSKPKTWVLPGTNTSMNIGGYAKLDFIYDINAFLGNSLGVPGSSGSAAENRQGNVRVHARQSRVWFKTWTPTDWGELFTHIEGDFEGAGGNEVISNSSSLRLRHAYGRLGPVLAGQTWTNFMGIAHLPETIDFAGPSGESFIRQAQIRYTQSLGNGTTVAVSVENPEDSGVLTPANGALAGTVVGSPPDHIPDFVGTLFHKFGRGSAQLSVVGRQISIDDGAGLSDNAFGWGIHGSGSFNVTPNDSVSLGVNYGDGIGRYLLNAAGASAVVNGTGTDPATANIDTVKALGYWAAVRHKWTSNIRSNAVFGQTRIDVEDEINGGKVNIPGGTNDVITTVHANLLWSPVPQVNFGVEYIWTMAAKHNANNGRGSRIQVGMQYKF